MGTIKKVFWGFGCTWDYYDENLRSKINEIYQRRFNSYIVLISVTYQCNLTTPVKSNASLIKGYKKLMLESFRSIAFLFAG